MTETDKLLERLDRDLQELKVMVNKLSDTLMTSRLDFATFKAKLYTAAGLIGAAAAVVADWLKSVFF